MDPYDEDSGPFPYSVLPDPCDRCKQTICFFLHSYASTCPYNLCPECRELEALDAQIMDLHNQLINLSNKRHELKGRINRRHDRFTSRLPVELISDVFALIVHGTSNSHHLFRQENNGDLQWNPLLMLGGVCKRWRDITLGTPTLWTKISVGPRKDASFYDFTDRWLSRSGKLPLSLQFRSSVVQGNDSDDDDSDLAQPILPHSNPVQLLKSHANRWKDLTLLGSTAMLPMILTGIEDRLVLDSLLMHVVLDDSEETDEIIMKYPFVPKRLSICFIPVRKIPVQWDMLTYLKAEYVSIDGLLHLIRHAHNLQNCVLHYVEMDEGRYPIPISPATNYSVEEFHVETIYYHNIIRLLVSHLTFPSLKILRWSRLAHYDNEDLNALNDFLNRSQPPLDHFSFRECHSIASSSFDWSGILPSITSLELDIHHAYKELTKIYIDSLGAHVLPMAFPRLRDLKIRILEDRTNPDWWSGLAAIFPASQINRDAPTPMFSRPLKAVTVMIDPSLDLKQKIMDRATHSRLRAIRDSGVDIKVLNNDHERIDILGPDVQLVFSE